MEEFLDYILIAVLILLLGFFGVIMVLLEDNPLAAYALIAAFVGSIGGVVGIVGWKWYQKKRLAPYYDLLQDVLQIQKDIFRATARLERPLKNMLKDQFPNIRQLTREARKRLYNITEIDRVLADLEQQQSHRDESYRRATTSPHPDLEEKLHVSHTRYAENLKRIQDAKDHDMQQVEQILRVLQELHSQILALKYARGNTTMQQEIADTIDDLFIDMQSLEELT